MSSTRACPECGAGLPHDSPRGLCPRCLMGAAMAETAEQRPAAPPAPAIGLDELRRASVEAGLVGAPDFDGAANSSGGDPARAARELVRLGKLTPYQAGALVQGKGRGLLIGSYLVLDRIGRGGMGVVFKARHRRDGRVVALKILPPSFGRDGEAVARFRREFELAAALRHPNVVAAVDADEDRGVAFLTMDYVDGEDLDGLVSAVGPLPVRLAISCAAQAAAGLAAAHARGIVHRDIKPANLMLDASGIVRVLDLGLARVVEATNPLGKGAGTSLTQSGAYMGTVDFMAPEQADDSRRADARSDIYSLACTLHFLLTGRPPFDGDSAMKRLMAHQSRPAPSLIDARDDVPEPLEALYQSMMAKRPADRPGSMAEVIERLEACRSASDDARAGLKRAFAETALKRATPRGRDRPRDASIYARPTGEDGPRFDPGLRFEDLVMDLRPEHRSKPLDEEDLPPVLPRIALPRGRSRARRPAVLIAVSLAAIALPAALLLAMRPGRQAARPETSPGAVPGAGTPREMGPFQPLFNGKDLAGWLVRDALPGDWRVDRGVLSGVGRAYTTLAIFTERTYGDFVLRFEYETAGPTDSGLLLTSRESPGVIWQGEFNISNIAESPQRTGDYTEWGSTYEGPGASAKTAAAAPKGGGTWNAAALERRGGKMSLAINGRLMHEGLVGGAGPARIGFQAHAGTIRLRSVELREPTDASSPDPFASDNGFVSLFNGKDLFGWAGNVSDFQVKGGVLGSRLGWAGAMYYPKELTDFAARVEFRLTRGGNSGLCLRTPGHGNDHPLGRLCEVEIIDDAPKEDGKTTGYPTGSAYSLVAAEGGHLRKPGEWNAMEVTVRGLAVKVVLNGAVVLDTDLGLSGEVPAGTELASGYFGLAGTNRGVEYRKIELRDLAPGREVPSRRGRLPRTLFVDDFEKPRKYWSSTSPEDLARGIKHIWGHRDGIFFDETREPASYSGYLPIDRVPDFALDVTARVTGDKPTSRGSFLIQAMPADWGFQVRIDGTGALFVEPSLFTRGNHPEGPWLGPITHPKIIPGGAGYNKLRLLARGRRLEIVVNGARVCEPLVFDRAITPAWITVGVGCREPTVRAEFDRVEVHSLTEAPEPSEGGGTPIRITTSGGTGWPDGTLAYEGAGFKPASSVSGAVHEQDDMLARFHGPWTNDRHLFWDRPKEGDVLALDLPAEGKGLYQVVGAFTMSWDYGRFKLALDGQPLLGDRPIDLYAAQVQPTGPVVLGTVQLVPGRSRRLTATNVGKAPSSTGVNFGLDEIRLVPVP